MKLSVLVGYNITFRLYLSKLYYIMVASTLEPYLLNPVSLHSLHLFYKNQNCFSYEKFHLFEPNVG